jgi:hypothetical protein
VILEKRNKNLTQANRLSARKEKKMIDVQETLQQNRTEEALMAWLRAKSTQQFRQFLASPWVASLFSPETIEHLYEELRQQEEEVLIEVGQD